MIFDHRDHGMRDVSLFLAQSSIDVLLELLCELLDDGGRVADLLTIQFNEGQLSFFGMKFEFVVDILRGVVVFVLFKIRMKEEKEDMG